MADRSTQHPPGVDDLLAPPPFGVAETTGDQLLPIATSMEHVLDEDPMLVPEPEPPIVTPPEPRAAPKPSPPVAAPRLAAVEADEPASSNRIVVIAVVAVLLLGAGGFLWMTRGSDAVQDDATAQADAGGVGTPEHESAATPSKASATPDQPVPSETALPTELDALRKLSFKTRHAGLAHASGDVPVELHVGLDLVQAQQSEEPCRTFSDALSTIESSEEPATYKWALDEATAPTGEDDPSCEPLAKRLATARGSDDEVEASKPRRPRTTRDKPRSKPRASRPSPAAKPSPPAKPPEKVEPAKPNPPPAREAPSVATKLDDDLRGLGE